MRFSVLHATCSVRKMFTDLWVGCVKQLRLCLQAYMLDMFSADLVRSKLAGESCDREVVHCAAASFSGLEITIVENYKVSCKTSSQRTTHFQVLGSSNIINNNMLLSKCAFLSTDNVHPNYNLRLKWKVSGKAPFCNTSCFWKLNAVTLKSFVVVG